MQLLGNAAQPHGGAARRSGYGKGIAQYIPGYLYQYRCEGKQGYRLPDAGDLPDGSRS